MKRQWIALTLCALWGFAACASPLSAASDEAAKPLLWKVSDADNSVYLLGSFHLLKQEDYPLPAELDRAFNDSKTLMFEVDPAALTSPETQASMQKYMAYEDGKTLSTVLPKDTLNKLNTLLSAGGGSLQAVEHSEPWAVNLSLVLSVTQAMGFRPELGVDQYFMRRAAEAGKPATGLETIDDQMRAMDGVPYAEQAQGMEEFLNDPQKSIRQLQELHGWWRAGNVEKLDEQMRAEMARKTPESYRLLDVERNNSWLPQVEKRLVDEKKDNTLIIVGALHLLGSDGLVEQLRAKGYTVERVCDACAVN